LNGALTRLLHHEAPVLLWLVVGGIVGLALLLHARSRWRRGDHEGALLLSAGAMLLCSPISWDHHFVWCAPLLAVLWRRARMLVLPVAALLLVGPRQLVAHGEHRELTWGLWHQLPGNGYTWLVLLLAVVSGLALGPRRPGRPGPGHEVTTSSLAVRTTDPLAGHVST